jgi:hypothetical protein
MHPLQKVGLDRESDSFYFFYRHFDFRQFYSKLKQAVLLEKKTSKAFSPQNSG